MEFKRCGRTTSSTAIHLLVFGTDVRRTKSGHNKAVNIIYYTLPQHAGLENATATAIYCGPLTY
jgi:hypothetical protein